MTASVLQVCGQRGSSNTVIDQDGGSGSRYKKGSAMADFWNTLVANFGGFDGITFAIMAIVVVGAAFMMPTMAAIVTATCGALFVFAFALFLRAVLAASDASAVARADLAYGLMLPARTLLVYGAAFCFSIAIVHGVRMLSKE